MYDPETDEVVFVSDEEAEFFGVYREEHDNSLTLCMDFATKSGAERYLTRLKLAH